MVPVVLLSFSISFPVIRLAGPGKMRLFNNLLLHFKNHTTNPIIKCFRYVWFQSYLLTLSSSTERQQGFLPQLWARSEVECVEALKIVPQDPKTCMFVFSRPLLKTVVYLGCSHMILARLFANYYHGSLMYTLLGFGQMVPWW